MDSCFCRIIFILTKNIFNISFKAVELECSQLSLFVNVVHLYFQRCLHWVLNFQLTKLFSFSTSETWFHYGLDRKSLDKLVDILMFIPLNVMCLFLWLNLRILPSSLAFRNLIVMCFGVVFFVFKLLKFFHLLGYVCL